MPIRLSHEDSDIYRVDIRGTLRSGELADCQRALAAAMNGAGTVRLLVVLEQFAGWEGRDDWRDLTFYATRGDAITRIAIVGPEEWRSHLLLFAAADLRKGAVEFFPENDLANARAWLAGEPVPLKGSQS